MDRKEETREERRGEERRGAKVQRLLETSRRRQHKPKENSCKFGFVKDLRKKKKKKKKREAKTLVRVDAMDDSTDMEMKDTKTSTNDNTHQSGVVREMLALARQLINQGKPSQALQAVVMAVRTNGGDEAVFQSLHRARELYRTRLQANSAVDQLAYLFAECAIAEAQPLESEPSQCNVGGPSVAPDAQGNSILAETGRNQIVLDAFSDGSSFICLQCGGLVSNHRKEEHYAYWCGQI